MMTSSTHEITQLLLEWNRGNDEALEKLTPLVYAELHRAAKRCMARERPGHTLQTTALINELYLRVTDLRRVSWQSRAHFLGLCAHLMRQILTDLFRSQHRQKRGGGAEHVSLDGSAVVSLEARHDVVAIDEALERLSAVDKRKGQVVELRFFGGLSVRETAEVLKVSDETVMRDWRLAKAWLLSELTGPSDNAT
jgi:RNA polymerase sigma factor (TIGR02999 family)